jgi:hypothetical protein
LHGKQASEIVCKIKFHMPLFCKIKFVAADSTV